MRLAVALEIKLVAGCQIDCFSAREMKIIQLLILGASIFFGLAAHADEKGGSVLGGLSSTVLGGYVNTSIQGNMSVEVCTNLPIGYVQSLKAKRQQMISRFKSAYLSNRCFGGNQQVTSMQAMFYQLLATNRFSSTTFSFDGFAYYDMPGALSGQYGTLLMPDMQVLRLTKKQMGKPLPVSGPSSPQSSPTSGATFSGWYGSLDILNMGVGSFDSSGLVFSGVGQLPSGIQIINRNRP
jgi:hypothetical protein